MFGFRRCMAISDTPAVVAAFDNKVVKVFEVERKFAWGIADSMDCDGLRITADTKAVLP
jgi:hypothetical protein